MQRTGYVLPFVFCKIGQLAGHMSVIWIQKLHIIHIPYRVYHSCPMDTINSLNINYINRLSKYLHINMMMYLNRLNTILHVQFSCNENTILTFEMCNWKVIIIINNENGLARVNVIYIYYTYLSHVSQHNKRINLNLYRFQITHAKSEKWDKKRTTSTPQQQQNALHNVLLWSFWTQHAARHTTAVYAR